MRAEFHPEARIEFGEAVSYYRKIQPRLGVEFRLEIESLVRGVCSAPTRWRKFDHGVRRCGGRRFPYAILYVVLDEAILILAVMHGSRKQGYWHHRQP